MSLRILNLGLVLTGVFGASAEAQMMNFDFPISNNTPIAISQNSNPLTDEIIVTGDLPDAAVTKSFASPKDSTFITNSWQTSDDTVPVIGTNITGTEWLLYTYTARPQFALFGALALATLIAESILLVLNTSKVKLKRKGRRSRIHRRPVPAIPH